MKTITSKSLVGFALIAFLMISGTLMAQYPGQRGMRHMRNQNSPVWSHMSIPDLTEEQKEKIGKLNLEFEKNTLQKHNLIREKEAQLRTAVTQPDIVLDKTDKLIDEISSIRSEIRKERIRTDARIRELLTDDQKVMFDRMRSQRPGFGSGRS
ncbi:MAG TPA: periplasmic heavy metal sensor [Cyclobacteriaceae bacterium]|nr:periplasmic heavy metal sensor [Cyclobacteriaceae bacterium]